MTRSRVYLDHNAGSPLRVSARTAMLAALELSGNASSVHAEGRAQRAIVERARESVAKLAGAKPASVIFTANGSEANAAALHGAVAGAALAEDRKAQKRVTRLFVSAIEHDSVRAMAASLMESTPGLKLYEIPVNAEGVIDLAALRRQFMEGKGRALVCVMAVNNETGALQPIHEIGKTVRTEAADALIHVDAVALAGHGALAFDAWDIDYLSLSSHKLGGPQGAGALIVKDTAPFTALIAGAQEQKRRAGTENVAAIAGFGAAAQEAADGASENARQRALRDAFEAKLKALAPQAAIFSGNVQRLSNTSNFAIPNVSAETALIALDLDGVALSSGAACSSGRISESHVLDAMGVAPELARCALRVSLGWNSTQDDIEAALVALKRLLERKASLAA
jgi:cysteine desulfurase